MKISDQISPRATPERDHELMRRVAVGDLPEVAHRSQTPEEDLQHRERALAVRSALDRLPPRRIQFSLKLQF